VNTCETCRSYDSGSGTCRIRPPQIIIDAQGDWVTAFPEVGEADWCGEWQTAKYRYVRNCECGKKFTTNIIRKIYCCRECGALYRERKCRAEKKAEDLATEKAGKTA